MGNESDWETYAEEVNRPKGGILWNKNRFKGKEYATEKKIGTIVENSLQSKYFKGIRMTVWEYTTGLNNQGRNNTIYRDLTNKI